MYLAPPCPNISTNLKPSWASCLTVVTSPRALRKSIGSAQFVSRRKYKALSYRVKWSYYSITHALPNTLIFNSLNSNIAELKHNKVSNNISRVTQNYTNHGGNKDTKCVIHPDGNHTTAECNKLRNLKGIDKGKGMRTEKRSPRNQTRPYQHPANAKGKGTDRKGGEKGKGKPPSMGSRTPRTDITCDHCQKKRDT